MALYTKKGDDGTTGILSNSAISATGRRISKSSNIAEALGSLDEINSFLGLCKVQSAYLGFKLGETNLSEIIHEIQKNLFIVQAELAGAEKTIEEKKVKELEEIIGQIEKELPPIKSFFISGGPADLAKREQAGAGLGAALDIARTIARRAERKTVVVSEELLSQTLFEKDFPSQASENKLCQISRQTLAYLNRLSSALYALARYANHKVGITEEAPDYK